ncbi:MAG: hypothetical protein ACYDHN_01090 [Solirubrobacteraceae bacterium]
MPSPHLPINLLRTGATPLMAAIALSGLLIAAPAGASPQREAERTTVRVEREAAREAARAAREAARAERQAQRAERLQGTRSERHAVRVAPEVTIVAPPEGTQLIAAGVHRGATASTSATVTFTGTVTPLEEGSKVVLQRERIGSGDEWRRIGLGQVAADGTYSISHSFAQPGNVNIRVIVRSPGHNLPGVSEPLSYEISQRQNPQLTIQSSFDPISYGQSTTISGALAAGGEQQVTLIGRTRGGSYTTLATTTSDASGAYSFPALSPTQNMDYRVTSGHIRSSILSQGVRPLLSAQMSFTAIPGARQLTFTGTVSPDRTGQLVYLLRQRSSGVGFNLVASATIATGSTYTIPYTLLGSAAERFRVKLPGNAESLVAASPQFTVPALEG